MTKDWTKILYWVVGIMGVGILFKKASTTQTGQDVTSSAGNLVASTVGELLGTTQKNFVDKMQPITAQIQALYGIDPLITITQAALESGWGTSGLTVKANNLYGFTGDSWAKEGKAVINLPTHEYSSYAPDQIQFFNTPGDIISKTANANGGTDLMVNRPFRSYPTWYDSVSDWAQLISEASRYAQAYADAKNGDLQSFAADVAAAGYATEPDYAAQLVSVGTKIQGIA